MAARPGSGGAPAPGAPGGAPARRGDDGGGGGGGGGIYFSQPTLVPRVKPRWGQQGGPNPYSPVLTLSPPPSSSHWAEQRAQRARRLAVSQFSSSNFSGGGGGSDGGGGGGGDGADVVDRGCALAGCSNGCICDGYASHPLLPDRDAITDGLRRAMADEM